jgi:formate-dependent nitrite reductase membrane component NrfD
MSYDTPPPPPPGGTPYGAPPPAQANSSKPVWSLVCGIVGLVLCGIVLGIVAIVLGRQAQREGRPGGMARAGEILGYVDVVLSILFIVYYVSR